MRACMFASRGAVVALLLMVSLSHDAHAGLLARWSFDGCSSADLSGHGRDLTRGGAPVCQAGHFGEAWKLDGVSDFLEVLDSEFAPGLRAWSVAAWVRTDSVNQYYAVVHWYRCGAQVLCNSGDAAAYFLGVDHGQAFWFVRDDLNNINSLTDAGSSVADGAWHFLVGTMNATTDSVRLYVDGVLHVEGNLPFDALTAASVPLEVGRQYTTSGTRQYFPGLIDEVRVFSHELTAEDIQDLYTNNPVVAVRAASWGQIKALYR